MTFGRNDNEMRKQLRGFSVFERAKEKINKEDQKRLATGICAFVASSIFHFRSCLSSGLCLLEHFNDMQIKNKLDATIYGRVNYYYYNLTHY